MTYPLIYTNHSTSLNLVLPGLPQGVVAPLGLHNKVDILGLSLPARSRCSLGLLGSDVLNCLG
jgi:hypothetical protein